MRMRCPPSGNAAWKARMNSSCPFHGLRRLAEPNTTGPARCARRRGLFATAATGLGITTLRERGDRVACVDLELAMAIVDDTLIHERMTAAVAAFMYSAAIRSRT